MRIRKIEVYRLFELKLRGSPFWRVWVLTRLLLVDRCGLLGDLGWRVWLVVAIRLLSPCVILLRIIDSINLFGRLGVVPVMVLLPLIDDWIVHMGVPTSAPASLVKVLDLFNLLPFIRVILDNPVYYPHQSLALVNWLWGIEVLLWQSKAFSDLGRVTQFVEALVYLTIFEVPK